MFRNFDLLITVTGCLLLLCSQSLAFFYTFYQQFNETNNSGIPVLDTTLIGNNFVASFKITCEWNSHPLYVNLTNFKVICDTIHI
jgi:hypothetical protein